MSFSRPTRSPSDEVTGRLSHVRHSQLKSGNTYSVTVLKMSKREHRVAMTRHPQRKQWISSLRDDSWLCMPLDKRSRVSCVGLCFPERQACWLASSDTAVGGRLAKCRGRTRRREAAKSGWVVQRKRDHQMRCPEIQTTMGLDDESCVRPAQEQQAPCYEETCLEKVKRLLEPVV